MMEVYKKYDINPMKSALGCLPVLIQMPIVMGLYFVLRYRIGGGITEHPHFLWFNLVHRYLDYYYCRCVILYSSMGVK